MEKWFSNQVVVITGAGRGIGFSTAKLFAQYGANLVINDYDANCADNAANELKGFGCQVLSVPGDVTDPKYPDSLMKKAAETFGKINVIVNNAGYTWDGMVHKMTDKQFTAMLEIHNVAPFRMIRAAAPYMREVAKQEKAEGKPHEPRSIVNISSLSGLNGNIGQANYSTAKSGVIGLTKTVAKEWGPFGIRCNAVAFGFIETRLIQDQESGEQIQIEGETIKLGIPSQMKGMAAMLIPLGRCGTPDEAAGPIVFLASPLASYITGVCLEVTGGL